MLANARKKKLQNQNQTELCKTDRIESNRIEEKEMKKGRGGAESIAGGMTIAGGGRVCFYRAGEGSLKGRFLIPALCNSSLPFFTVGLAGQVGFLFLCFPE